MADRMGMLWTTEEIDGIKAAINNGASLTDLCETFGRTPYGIIGKLTALRILVEVGRDYHLINPEPWALGSEVYALQKAVKKE